MYVGAGLEGRPVFDTAAGEPAAARSRMLAGAASAGAQGSPFTRTLAACADGGDYTSLTALLRGMSPAAVDAELRCMLVPSPRPAPPRLRRRSPPNPLWLAFNSTRRRQVVVGFLGRVVLRLA